MGWKSISVTRAIETAKQLRERLNLLKTLATTKKREYNVHHRSGAIMEQIALFDPGEFKKQADNLSRQVELLSSRIDKVNYTVEIEIPLASKYLEA
jgi:predicted RNA-binding protein with PIN domain